MDSRTVRKISNEFIYDEDLSETDLPEGWYLARLGEVCERITDGTHKTPRYVDNGIPFISTANIIPFRSGFDFSSYQRFVTPEEHNELTKRCRPEKGDILVSKCGTIGRAKEVDVDYPFSIFVGLALLKPYKGIFSHKFSEYLFNYESISKEFERLSPGSTRKTLTLSAIKTLRFPLPPIAEQKRIVAKVEELLALVNSAKERLNKVSIILKRFRQAVLAAACSGRLTADWREDRIEIEPVVLNSGATEVPDALATLQEEKPQSWTLSSVDQVTHTIQYGYTASAKKEPVGPKFLRISDIQNGQVDWDDVPYCAIPGDHIPKFLLKHGDIVFARTGATTGKSFLIRTCPKTVFASYLIRVQPLPIVDPEFLYLFFQSDLYWKQISENISGSAQPNCNASKLASLILPLPPVPEQQEIVRRVEAMFKLADVVEKRVESAKVRAEKLTQAILAKAFRGELVPTEAELARREGRSYESASELLFRIKSQRELRNKPAGVKRIRSPHERNQ